MADLTDLGQAARSPDSEPADLVPQKIGRLAHEPNRELARRRMVERVGSSGATPFIVIAKAAARVIPLSSFSSLSRSPSTFSPDDRMSNLTIAVRRGRFRPASVDLDALPRPVRLEEEQEERSMSATGDWRFGCGGGVRRIKVLTLELERLRRPPRTKLEVEAEERTLDELRCRRMTNARYAATEQQGRCGVRNAAAGKPSRCRLVEHPIWCPSRRLSAAHP
jgi:hypothetical protein